MVAPAVPDGGGKACDPARTAEPPREFLYRLPGRPGGSRPGMHASRAIGPGSAFATHGRLFDRPDPRRLDLRASLSSVPREWLVRLNRQRSGVSVQAIVDVSASMRFGGDAGGDAGEVPVHEGKSGVAIEFVRALGHSAFRSGDAAGLLTFGERAGATPAVAPRAGRGVGETLATVLAEALRERPADAPRRGPRFGRDRDGRRARAAEAEPRSGEVLRERAALAAGAALVFVVSDFHFALDSFAPTVESLAPALVVPLVVRDPAELAPPAGDGWLELLDLESGRRRPLWMSERTRRAWREAVAHREARLDAIFAACDVRPLRLSGGFDPDTLTRYFVEAVA